MAGTGKKWLIGCGAGCGAVLLLGILISIGGSLYMMRPFNEAIDAQQTLEAEFGTREAFVPGSQGITPDRLDKFIAVRRALVPLCEEFRKIGDSFAVVEELDKEGGEPSKKEALKAVGNLMGNIFGMVGNIGRFTEERNLALLENDMSLGEYAWIYVLVYNSWLGEQPNQDFEETGGRGYSASERRLMRALVANHAQALAAVGMVDEADLWEREVGRMERAETGVPFKDGSLPASYVRQFLSRENELEALFCEATSSFELNRVQKKGLSIRSE